MEKELRERVKLVLPEGECMLEYYLIKHSVLDISPRLHLYTYGVEIVKRSCGDGEIMETRLISDICCSVMKMNDMISLLARNTVTPMCLHDVIEDFINNGMEKKATS